MQQLIEIMQILRKKCPWDQAQTPQSLTRYAIEEAYEVEAAVREGDTQHIQEELGDLLLQVVFQSQMYAEQGKFTFDDVVNTLVEKLVRRHPHVFDGNYADLNQEQVSALWQQIKQKEKQQAGQNFVSQLEQVKAGPSLMQAQKLQKQAAQLSFDWDHVDGAFNKLSEEISELKDAVLTQDSQHIQEELGDCLFSLVNVGRKLDQDCESALLSTIHKFRTRFSFIERELMSQNLMPEQCSLEQLDHLWEQAKKYEKNNKNKILY